MFSWKNGQVAKGHLGSSFSSKDSFPRTIPRVSLGEGNGKKGEKGQSSSYKPSSSNIKKNPLIVGSGEFTDSTSSFATASGVKDIRSLYPPEGGVRGGAPYPPTSPTGPNPSPLPPDPNPSSLYSPGIGVKRDRLKSWVASNPLASQEGKRDGKGGDSASATPFGVSRGPENKGVWEAGGLPRVVSITYEEIGLFPRSFSRVLDRFLKQVFSDVENLVVREYRFYRYLFLTTLKCLLILFFVPFFVNWIAKTYVVRPLTEYFWNGKQTEIFLNSYQQKRAFRELKDFEEKLYFESLVYPKTAFSKEKKSSGLVAGNHPTHYLQTGLEVSSFAGESGSEASSSRASGFGASSDGTNATPFAVSRQSEIALAQPKQEIKGESLINGSSTHSGSLVKASEGNLRLTSKGDELSALSSPTQLNPSTLYPEPYSFAKGGAASYPLASQEGKEVQSWEKSGEAVIYPPTGDKKGSNELLNSSSSSTLSQTPVGGVKGSEVGFGYNLTDLLSGGGYSGRSKGKEDEKTESLINAYTLKSSLFVYQTIEADKNIQQRYQEKTIELAQRYNDQSIEAITNFFADCISLLTLFYLLYALEIQINITKSFLLEVFFGLDDSKKSLLILLVTDLLVGYHSSNLWELFFEFLFHHYGLPESQTGIFLLVATLPVLLDVLFKYLIFRHLNRSSPATVATYHAMIE
jgi:hypothetical protein